MLSDSVVAQIPGALQLGPPTEAPLKGKAAATALYPCLGFVEPDTIFLVPSSFARIAERAEEFARASMLISSKSIRSSARSSATT